MNESPIRYVEFRGGRFLARVFLAIEPVVGLSRSARLMAALITHWPFLPSRRSMTDPKRQDPPPDSDGGGIDVKTDPIPDRDVQGVEDLDPEAEERK